MADPDDQSTLAVRRRLPESAAAAPPDFGPRYRVLGRLGKGGMGEVYRAYDIELHGEVALKIVRGDAEGDEALARFRREIALARKITSPNVLRVYDLAEHAGLRFLTMEYVDGEDLLAMMRREGRMPLPRALALFRQVCVGLEAAHAQGVVHRDLKPDNVLVDRNDCVRVADFGLARTLGDSALTVRGDVLGSPAYMSPEQVKGDPIDERSDLYSLGIMLYQLVTGTTPFRADTPHAVMEMRLHKVPRPLCELCPDTPDYLQGIVARCLAVDPAGRYASVHELVADLDATRAPAAAKRLRPRWLAPVVGAAAVAAGALAVVLARPHHHAPTRGVAPAARPATAEPSSSGPITVLVLGTENRTTDPLFDGTLDLVLDYALRRSERLDPIAGAELRALASELGPNLPLGDELGQKLAARDHERVVVVHASVVPRGAGVAISMTADDAGTGTRVFAKTLDAPAYSSVAAVTGTLAAGLRTALGDRVADPERTGMSANLEADHELSVALANHFMRNNVEAATHLERAVALAADFGLAHAFLAKVYWNLDRTAEAGEQMKLAVKDVDQLGERDQLSLLGTYYTNSTGDFGRAIETYQKLLVTWPKDMAAENNIAVVYSLRHDASHALEFAERAIRDHPHDVTPRANLVTYDVSAGQLERAVTDANRVLADFPHPPVNIYRRLGIAQALLGHDADARDAYQKLAQSRPSEGDGALADLAMAEGRLSDAATLLDQALTYDAAHHLPGDADYMHVMQAELRLWRGDKAGARAAAALVTDDSQCLFAAALVQLASGDPGRARATEARLADDVTPTRRAMAKLIEGEALRHRGQPTQAMVVIRDALRLSDLPLGHLLLARAALDGKRFADAYGELKSCLGWRGEIANHSFLADPAVRYIPQLTYYLARAQEGLGSSDATGSYREFLAVLHDADHGIAMVDDARRRAR